MLQGAQFNNACAHWNAVSCSVGVPCGPTDSTHMRHPTARVRLQKHTSAGDVDPGDFCATNTIEDNVEKGRVKDCDVTEREI